jgi:hypothetical protein
MMVTRTGKKEQEAKRHFLKLWRSNDRWAGTHEYAMGGSAGAPDVEVLAHVKIGKHLPKLVPLEFKLAEKKPNPDRTKAHSARHEYVDLFLHEVRPAQIQWHKSFIEAGGTSLVIACVWDKEWEYFAVFADDLRGWREGIPVLAMGAEGAAFKIWPSRSTLNEKLERYLRNVLGLHTSHWNKE